jgi:DNA-binding MarR family transcriptional regulator
LFLNNGRVHPTPTDIWQQLVSLVMDSRGDWRRSVVAATGLPFTRVRALRRLADGPLTLAELADAMTVDPPAATVAVNDLEERGLVRRTPHPTNKRCKVVTLTEEGLRTVDIVRSVSDEAPASLAALPGSDLADLGRLLDKIHHREQE